MKRFALVMLVTLALVSCSKKENLDPNVVRIGTSIELTGSVPAIGASSKNAALLAVKEINAKGGIDVHSKKIPVQLIIEDDANQADQAAASVAKLISEDNVLAVVGPNASLGAVPAAAIAEDNQTVLITPWSTNPKVTMDSKTNQPRHYVFRACFTDPFEGKVLARFAVDKLKYKTAAVLYDVGSEAPNSQAKVFSESFTTLGGKIVDAETYSGNDKDFTAQLTKIKVVNPEVIFLPAYYNDVPLITQQAKRLGIKAAFLGSDAWSSPDLIPMAQGAVEGAYFVNHYSADAKNEVTQKFVKNYEQSYGSKPDDIAALTYDAYQVLFQAIAKAPRLTRQDVRDSLAHLAPVHGVTGVIKYKDNSGDPIKTAVIMQIKNGKFTWVANGEA